MRLVFPDPAWEDNLPGQAEDLGMTRKVDTLIRETRREPFKGIGKPEPLKGPLTGYGSRRISGEHRMVYKVASGDLLIAQLRYHY